MRSSATYSTTAPDFDVDDEPSAFTEEAATDTLPPSWTADHVALRLVDAFRTLDRLPRPKGPRAAGNHWPRHRVEFADLVAQAELPDIEKRERAERRNADLCRPGGADIARMDRVLEWMRGFRGVDADLAILVTLWALRVARRRSLRALCRERGWTPPTFYKRRDRALAALADRLNAERAPVF